MNYNFSHSTTVKGAFTLWHKSQLSSDQNALAYLQPDYRVNREPASFEMLPLQMVKKIKGELNWWTWQKYFFLIVVDASWLHDSWIARALTFLNRHSPKFIKVLKCISSQMLKTLKKNLIDQQSQKNIFPYCS